jgi:type II secretory pathway pseudopilin PulG
MKALRNLIKNRAFTMPELLIGAAISTVIAGGMVTTISALQHTTAASVHHAQSQIQQARLVDYISRDLRRAVSVNVDTFNGSERLTVKIPNFYDPAGQPREPVIDGGGVRYGDGGSEVTITYYIQGDKVYRSVNGLAAVVANDLASFKIDFTDSGKQAVTIAISFVPRYQFNRSNAEANREATTAYATTLLRNTRQ